MSRPMHVGLEATAACRPVHTGIARYAYSLMAALLSEAQQTDERYTAYAKLSRLWKKNCKPDPMQGLPWRYYADVLPLLLDKPDVMHGLELCVPARFKGPRVATLHDLFGIVSPELLNPKARERNAARYSRLAQCSDHVITISACTRQDFLEAYDFQAERVHVVHLGVDPCFVPCSQDAEQELRGRLGLDGPFLLYVGDITPRKNLLRLLKAFGESKAAADHNLVIVGAREDGAGELSEALAKSPARERVRLLGWTPEEDLLVLYAAADALLFPTLYEGFGLPVLEALACETPVLGGDRGSVPEIAGGHVTLTDPRDVDAIVQGIQDVLKTTREQVEAARLHAQSFTWERCARETRAVYRIALDSH